MKKQLLLISGLVVTGLMSFGQTVFLSEDFQSGFPAGWSQSTASNDGGWNIGTGPALSSNGFPIIEHGSIIATNDDGCNCDKSADSLFTDTVDLTAASGLIVLGYDMYYAEATYQGATESLDFYVYNFTDSSWNEVFDAPQENAWFWKDGSLLDLSAFAGDSIMVAFVYNDGGGWTYGAALDNVSIFEAAQYNVNNISVDNPPYHEVNTSTDITGEIVNMGSETITSIDMAYIVDGGTPVIASLTGLSIDPLESYEYTHPTAWNPTTQQTSEITTAVALINGNLDADNGNDTASTNVLVHPTAVVRKPLIESYTSSTCGPCTQGNINVGNVLSSYSGEYSKVNYQMSWPGAGDPYYTDEAGVRRTYHGVNSVPNVFTDGVDHGNSQSYTSALVDAALDVPAFVDITVETATIQKHVVYEMVDGELEEVSSSYTVDVEADMTPIINIPSGQVAHLAIIENLTEENVGTNGETEFEFVMKKMLPNANGTPLAALPANQTVSHSGTWEIQGDYRLPPNAGDPINHASEHSIEEFNDLSVVVWLEDQGAGEVWQSENGSITMIEEMSNVTDTIVDGEEGIVLDGVVYIENNSGVYVALGVNGLGGENISMFPNPANDRIFFKGMNGQVNVTVLDAMGRVALQTSTLINEINVSSLPAGVYSVIMEADDDRFVEKVTIMK